MTIEKLSKKQRMVLKWAHMESTRDKYRAIICDGAVRTGKTVLMSEGFVHWAMRFFDDCSFAITGRTVGAVERNIIKPLMNNLDITDYYSVQYSESKKTLTIKYGRRKNLFYVFGGHDEQSYMTIQGLTLCGVFFDEVALMPRSFVEQAIARTLSEKESKLWFNCNPDNPNHWFYKEWILDSEGENKKQSLHLHFKMADNPKLDENDIERARALYEGVFLQRYVEGEWVSAEGLVYSAFDERQNIFDKTDFGETTNDKWFISVDYGTKNPCSMGLWCIRNRTAFRVDEYYYDSRKKGVTLTDDEYYTQLESLAGHHNIMSVIVDPSAASFITLIRRRGRFNVVKAKNEVNDGIRVCAGMIKNRRIMIEKGCRGLLAEIRLYSWDDGCDCDRVIKENDHAMDEMRYFAYTILRKYLNFDDEKSKSRALYDEKFYFANGDEL